MAAHRRTSCAACSLVVLPPANNLCDKSVGGIRDVVQLVLVVKFGVASYRGWEHFITSSTCTSLHCISLNCVKNRQTARHTFICYRIKSPQRIICTHLDSHFFASLHSFNRDLHVSATGHRELHIRWQDIARNAKSQTSVNVDKICITCVPCSNLSDTIQSAVNQLIHRETAIILLGISIIVFFWQLAEVASKIVFVMNTRNRL